MTRKTFDAVDDRTFPSFTSQVSVGDIHKCFKIMAAEVALKGFIRNAILTPAVEEGIRTVLLEGLKIDEGDEYHAEIVADHLAACSVKKSHRPQRATLRRIRAARQLLQLWQHRPKTKQTETQISDAE